MGRYADYYEVYFEMNGVMEREFLPYTRLKDARKAMGRLKRVGASWAMIEGSNGRSYAFSEF